LGIRRRAVLLQEIGGQPEPVLGADPVPFDGRLSDGVRGAVQDAVGRRVRQGRSGDGLRHTGHQRRATDGFHDTARDYPEGGPVQHVQGFPATGQAEEEPARVHQRARHPRGRRRRDESRVRRGPDQGKHAVLRPGQQRSDIVRGVHKLRAAAHALGNRPERPSDGNGHTRSGRSGRREKPSRPRRFGRSRVSDQQRGNYRPIPFSIEINAEPLTHFVPQIIRTRARVQVKVY